MYKLKLLRKDDPNLASEYYTVLSVIYAVILFMRVVVRAHK